MTNNYIINKINWRQILTHLFATIFFIQAARQFSMLNDIEILKAIDKYGYSEALKYIVDQGNTGQRLFHFTLWINISVPIALLIAFIISVILTRKNKGFWQNSLIVLLIAILFNRLVFLDNKVIRIIFFSFGDLFSKVGLQYKFLANGVVLTLIGTFIFFNKLISNFAFNLRTKQQMNNVS